jgi:hypothetical protein
MNSQSSTFPKITLQFQSDTKILIISVVYDFPWYEAIMELLTIMQYG